MKQTAALYLRRSTDRQEQSIDDQKSALLRYAATHDLTVVREYVDDAISGATTAARKAFLRMLEDAKQRPRPFDLILVFDVSRFGRTDNDEAGHYRFQLRQAGVEDPVVTASLERVPLDGVIFGFRREILEMHCLTAIGAEAGRREHQP